MHAILLLTTLGCGPEDSDDTGAEDTAAPVDTAADHPIDDPTFEAHVLPVLSETCRGCHTGSFPQAGLALHSDRAAAYDNLVDVPSTQSDLLRVAPGDLEASYLWHKLSGTHLGVGGTGERMPPASRSLSDGELETVRRWIDGGAPR